MTAPSGLMSRHGNRHAPDADLQWHAIGRLYVDHRRWLLSWLRLRVNDVDLAEDIVQEAFLQLLSYDGLAQVREPRALLLSIARNLLLSRYRRQGHEKAYLDALADKPPQTVISLEERLGLVQTLAQVDEALAAVSAKARQAFLMSRIDGLDQTEIAARLEVSTAAVKRYVRLAFDACAAHD